MKRLLLCLVLLACAPAVLARTLVDSKDLGTQHGLRFERLRITGDSASVGSTIQAELVVRNISRHEVRLGAHGLSIAARDPQDRNRDFGHSLRKAVLHPGQRVSIKGSLRLDRPGYWVFWPGLQLANGQWGAYRWHAVRLKVRNRLVIRPPYAGCQRWHKAPGSRAGGSHAHAWCNRFSGYIGLMDSAFYGGAASSAMHTIHFRSPKKGKARVTAVFRYAGGAKTIGYASFAGFEAVYRKGRHKGRKEIVAGIDYEVIRDKLRDLALLAAPELTSVKSTREALEYLDLINSSIELGKLIVEGWQEKTGKPPAQYRYRFTIPVSKGPNAVDIGLRGNCSALVTGSSFVILFGQLQEVQIDLP